MIDRKIYVRSRKKAEEQVRVMGLSLFSIHEQLDQAKKNKNNIQLHSNIDA